MITKIKGTYDLLPEQTRIWQEIETVIYQVSKLYHFEEIRTPIFEASELFHRSVGESSDIVKKETYDFKDRGDRMITLRPEGTASVVRSVIENKLYASNNLPLKLYYQGPMFRYERPQKGRQRQFHQFGAEALGSFSPLVDAEMMSYAYTLLKALRIPNITLKINSLGDKTSQENYKAKLIEYLKPHVHELCEDCNRRYLENPLRVLDCKVDKENPVLLEAPNTIDSLTEEAKTHFDEVLGYLTQMGVPYEVDHRLVRGLDYYTHTVFELVADLETLGAQNTLAGGGRYNHLVSSLGGPEFPAVGFASGIERLILAKEALNQKQPTPSIHAFFLVLGDEAKTSAYSLIQRLRMGGIILDYDFETRGLKAQFKQAEKQNPMFYLIYGSEEHQNQTINIKNAKTGDQETVKIEDLYYALVEKIRENQHTCSHDCSSCEEDC